MQVVARTLSEPSANFGMFVSGGEDRPSSLKSLNLGPLIDREHDGVVGGIEVETDDVVDFLDKEGVVGDLEMALAMGLEAEQVEPPLDRDLGDSAVPCRGTYAPVGTLGRLGLQSRPDDFGHPFILMGAGASGTEFIVKSADSMVPIAFSLLADGGVGEA